MIRIFAKVLDSSRKLQNKLQILSSRKIFFCSISQVLVNFNIVKKQTVHQSKAVTCDYMQTEREVTHYNYLKNLKQNLASYTTAPKVLKCRSKLREEVGNFNSD